MATRRLSALLIVLFAFLMSGLWLISDESLDTNANTALDIYQLPITNNNGFIYLLGFDAPKGEDPHTIGKNRLLQYRGWQKNPTVMEAPFFSGVESIRAPSWFDGSDEQLVTYAHDIPYVIGINSNLYSRYQTFLHFNEFTTLIHFDAQTTEAISEGLILGNRFLRADVISKSLTGFSSQAAELLLTDIAAWRHQLQLSDNIAHKLLAARLLTKDFSLMTTLAKQNTWSPEVLELLINSLEPLTVQEISIERPLLHAEFSKLGYALFDATNNPEMIGVSQTTFWPLFLKYKPNMSINFLYKQYADIANKNNLPPRQIFSNLQTQQINEIEIPLDAWIKNSMGVKIVQKLSAFDFTSYTIRLWDVDVNRLLTRLVLETMRQNIHTESALNNFIQTPAFHGIWDNKPPHYSPRKSHLCYDGPKEDKKGLRCIDIAWLLQKSL